MPLPYWSIRTHTTEPSEDWPFKNVWLVTCPRCDFKMLVPKSWKRRNWFGTSTCHSCWGTNRIPGTVRRSIFDKGADTRWKRQPKTYSSS